MIFVIRKASYLASAEELNSENNKPENINKMKRQKFKEHKHVFRNGFGD